METMNKEGIALNKQQNTPNVLNPASDSSSDANQLWFLSIYNSETSKNQRSYIENFQNSRDGEQPQSPVQFSNGNDEDDDNSACFGENIHKMLKFGAESSQKISQHQKSTEKSSRTSYRIPNSESSIQKYKMTSLSGQKIYTDSEIDLMFSDLECTHLLGSNKNRLQINVKKVHSVLGKIPNEELKNFPKLYGNFFMKHLLNEKLIDESFGKDCLGSLIIWNYALNGGKRKEYEGKRTGKFLSKLDNLTNRNWRLPFLEFASTFDVRKIRAAKSKYQQRKLIYELVARLLKIAAEIILSHLQETFYKGHADITMLTLEEVCEDKIIIHFSSAELSMEALYPQESLDNQVVQPNTETIARRSTNLVPEFSSPEEEENTSQVNMLNDIDEGITRSENSDRLFSYTDTRQQLRLMEAEHSEPERGKDNENSPQDDFILSRENMFREMWLDIKDSLERHEQMLLQGVRGMEEEQPEDLSQDDLFRINNN